VWRGVGLLLRSPVALEAQGPDAPGEGGPLASKEEEATLPE
tara:strand:- start:2557 stop:2679 length:123 start_codon:yes stop_codon:yes gene_type:complete